MTIDFRLRSYSWEVWSRLRLLSLVLWTTVGTPSIVSELVYIEKELTEHYIEKSVLDLRSKNPSNLYSNYYYTSTIQLGPLNSSQMLQLYPLNTGTPDKIRHLQLCTLNLTRAPGQYPNFRARDPGFNKDRLYKLWTPEPQTQDLTKYLYFKKQMYLICKIWNLSSNL